jgi:hypothetical protein
MALELSKPLTTPLILKQHWPPLVSVLACARLESFFDYLCHLGDYQYVKRLSIKIFSSDEFISQEDKIHFPHYIFAPPITSSSLLNAIDEKVNIVGIINKDPKSNLNISSGEILDAIRCGIKIYGASEIGAIRALECNASGMIGVGEIFNFFKNDFLLTEDYFYSSDFSFSYIDFHFALEKLDPSLSLGPTSKDLLKKLYRQMNFNERNSVELSKKIDSLKIAEIEKINLHKSCEEIFSKKYSQQKVDANTLLRKIESDLIAIESKNRELWDQQKKQFNLSKCELLWK